MRSLLGLSPAWVVAIVAASACSTGGDQPKNEEPPDVADAASGGNGGEDAGEDAHHHAPKPGEDAAAPSIRCTDEELAATDMTDGGELEITFAKTANPLQYTNNCATVKVGATVVFSGSFFQHPLQAAGGDTPSPIPYTNTDPPDQKLSVTMSSPGTFGYECEFHPTLMYGAIKVVP